MQYVNGITVLFMVVCIGLGMAALWSRNEARNPHTLHQPGSGCIECEDHA
jgi:hypothetical protein